MISKTIKLSFVIAVAVICSYFVTQNAGKISVNLAPGLKLEETQAGFILVAVFFIGFILAFIISGYFAFKSFIRERKLLSKERKRKALENTILEARSYSATNNWKKAKDLWSSLIKKNPEDLIARIELSKALIGDENPKEALKTLDDARTIDANNTEILFRAANLNIELNNKTAAIDNLALLLYSKGNLSAAKLARDLSEELNRVEDALEYHNKALELGKNDKANKTISNRLEFKKLKSDFSQSDEYQKKLAKFVKRYPECVEALIELAEINLDSKPDEAAKLLVKAAKVSGLDEYWHKASKIWIDNDMPSKAIAAARTATKETKGEERYSAELDLIRMYLFLNMFEDSKKSIDGFFDLIKEVGIEPKEEILYELQLLNGFCLNQSGKYQEAGEIWKKLLKDDFEIKRQKKTKVIVEAPAPKLSTP